MSGSTLDRIYEIGVEAYNRENLYRVWGEQEYLDGWYSRPYGVALEDYVEFLLSQKFLSIVWFVL